ncbi:hypothetical protein MC885_012604, partial [Smutsia gigantea]
MSSFCAAEQKLLSQETEDPSENKEIPRPGPGGSRESPSSNRPSRARSVLPSPGADVGSTRRFRPRLSRPGPPVSPRRPPAPWPRPSPPGRADEARPGTQASRPALAPGSPAERRPPRGLQSETREVLGVLVLNLRCALEGRSDRSGGQGDSLYPVGYLDKQVPDTSVQETDRILVEKRCWDIALGPLKQIPMNLFIMYMAGNTISIFPTMMVCMMAWRPIQALMAISATFKMLESSSQKFLQGLVYLIGNLMGLALAVYKCQSMGLLPTHASDWLAFIEPPEDGVQWWRTAFVNLRKWHM